MIKKEYFKTREDGVNLFRTYSDANFMIPCYIEPDLTVSGYVND